jgi:hypothetical protein
MRSRNERISLRGWPPLWRALFAALALVLVALAGGEPSRAQEGVGREVETGIRVRINAATPPHQRGVLCAHQAYTFNVEPWALLGGMRNEYAFNYDHGIVTFDPPRIGKLSPSRYALTRDMPREPAYFGYVSDKEGTETLLFRAELPRIWQGRNPDEWFQKAETDPAYTFKVKECPMVIQMIYKLQILSVGTAVNLTGTLPETRLTRNEQGELEGNAQFKFEHTFSAPGCTFSASGFTSVTHIKGKNLPDTHKLEFTFDFGQGNESFTGTCAGRSGGGTETYDVARLVGVQVAQFPEDGGTREFPIPPVPAGSGSFTITVKQEDADSDLPVGG